MEPLRWVTLAAMTVFLIEGFALSVFPEQVRRILIDAEPRSLQVAGLVETVAAIGMTAILFSG